MKYLPPGFQKIVASMAVAAVFVSQTAQIENLLFGIHVVPTAEATTPAPTVSFGSPWKMKPLINATAGMTNAPDDSSPRFDAATALRICQLAGYSAVLSMTASSYDSCWDNEIWYSDAAHPNGAVIPACQSNLYLNTLTCGSPINNPPPPPPPASSSSSSGPVQTGFCPAGSPEVVIPANSQAGARYDHTLPSGQYRIEVTSPVGLSDAQYASYTWANWPTDDRARIHGSNFYIVRDSAAVYGPAAGGQRVANSSYYVDSLKLDPPYNNSRQRAADGARGVGLVAQINTGEFLTFVVDGIAGIGGQGAYGFNQGAVHVRICPVGTDVSITKTANPATVSVGSNTTFTVTVTNNGSSAAQDVSVHDLLPAGLTFVSDTVTAGAFTTPAIGNWNIGTLAPGASATMQIVATVATAGTFTNTATVSSSTQDTNPGNNSVSVSITGAQSYVPPTTSPEVCPAGSPLVVIPANSENGVRYDHTMPSGNYRIEVTSPLGLSDAQYASYTWANAPTDDTSRIHSSSFYVVRDSAPIYVNQRVHNAAFSIDSLFLDPPYNISRQRAADNGRGVGNVLHLNTGEFLTFVVNAAQGYYFQNRGSVQVHICPSGAPDSSSSSSFSVSSVSSSSSSASPQVGCIDIQKEAFDPSGNRINVVPQFTFNIDGTFAGVNDSAGNLHLSSISPGSHTITEMVPTGWSQFLITPTNGTVNVTAGNACAGVVVKDQQNALTSQSTDVSLTKDGPSTIAPGGTMNYTINITNNGPGSASNVRVVDHIPSFQGLLVGNIDQGCVISGGDIVCSLGNLNNGDRRAVHVSFAVPPVTCYGNPTITNTALVSTDTNDTNVSNNIGTVTTTLNCQFASSSSTSSTTSSASSSSSMGGRTLNVWWPTNNVHLMGLQPFKVQLSDTDVSQYQAFWQVDGDHLNDMPTNLADYPHKEALVDLGPWTWHPNGGTYVLTFVAKDMSGNEITHRTIQIQVDH
jgi:uncharacterized repeat protein (TIGR01451 family)